MEVVKQRPGNSIASRVAAYRRCGVLLTMVLVILVIVGYISFNREKKDIVYTKKIKREVGGPLKALRSSSSALPIDHHTNITAGSSSAATNTSSNSAFSLDNCNTSSTKTSIKSAGKSINLLDYAVGRYFIGIGDSLTYGSLTNEDQTQHHPYIDKLSELLHKQINIRAFGYPGIKSLDLQDKLIDIVSDSQFQKNISIIAILAGTNDLVQGDIPYQTILENLIELHKKVHESDESKARAIYTIAISIPYVNRIRVNNRIRVRVNQGLKVYAESCSYRVVYCDLSLFDPPTQATESNATAASRMRRRLDGSAGVNYIGADGVHLTAAGYDRMAEQLYETILKTKIQPQRYDNQTC
jgi:lysophospholipase L1-like esterase